MKKRILSFVLCGLLIAGASACVKQPQEKPKEKMSVILLAGQSNMEGNSYHQYLVGDERYGTWQDGFNDIKMAVRGSSGEAAFLPVKLGRGGVSMAQFGPEIGMAASLQDAGYDGKVCFVKYAVGGTTFHAYSPDSETWMSPADGEAGILYKRFVSFTITALEKLSAAYDVSLDAMCWMQGESDAFNPAYLEYEYNLRNFVDYLRLEFSDYNSDFMFYDAFISQFWGSGKDYKYINQAKAKLSAEDPKHRTIDTIAEGLEYDKEPYGNVDIYHYDALSEIKLGELFASLYMEDFPL